MIFIQSFIAFCWLVFSTLSLTNQSKAPQAPLAQRAPEGPQEKMAVMEEM